MFSQLQPVATDPILGLMAEYKADPNPLAIWVLTAILKSWHLDLRIRCCWRTG